jgi:hypothetical protein
MKSTPLIIAGLIFTFTMPALAYVGPGPGLSMVGSFFTLIAGIAIALFFVLLYPIRLILKNRKKKSADKPAE